MISKNFYLQLCVRIFLIAITAYFLAYYGIKENYYLSIPLLLFLGIQLWLFISYFNETNKQIAYFFESIKNEDFTLRFPEKAPLKSLQKLHNSLNEVNKRIKETYLKNTIQEKYYLTILEKADIGVLTYNKEGHIIFSNYKAKKLMNNPNLNHIRQIERVHKELYTSLKELKPIESNVFNFSNERELKQLVLKSSTIILEEEPLLLLIIQDIKKELDQKETDSWVKLIRVLTHEIMNTIAPITSISESILKYYDNTEGEAALQMDENQIKNTFKGLKVIQTQSKNLTDFVQSYRSLLSLPAPDKKIIDIKQLFHKIKLIYESDLNKKQIDLHIDSPDDFTIYIDEQQISQVLTNLVKNAIQSFNNTELPKIQMIAKNGNDHTKIIQIEDNGPGIPSELLHQIFIPFFTTKDDGTGIGLSLSKQILRLHNGTLDVQSNPNVSTIFTLTFNEVL